MRLMRFTLMLLLVTTAAPLMAQVSEIKNSEIKKSETVPVWPAMAPGESSDSTGVTLPFRHQDKPRITRIEKIRKPTIDVYPAGQNANGAAVVILPGGGFVRVVPDLEGSEAAAFLNRLGITCFVVNYRTSEVTPPDEPKWKRPLQDGQRTIRWVRANAAKWNLKTDKIGLLAFSAGGQVGSILSTTTDAAYDAINEVDKQSARPDFSMLVYPWRCYDDKSGGLIEPIKVTKASPPMFIVHTHDDRSTSLGAVLLYADLKKKNVAAELHVYENGGHGYGTRDRPNSNIGTWKHRAADWLARRLP